MRGWELLAGTVVGLAAGFVFWAGESDPSLEPPATEPSSPSDAAVVAPNPLAAELELLRERLAEETRRREELERRHALQPAPQEEARPEPDTRAKPAKKPSDGWLNEEALVRAGFRPTEVEELRALFESIELKRLFIRDQATREGWRNKPRFHRSMRALDREYDGLRDEYGDERYDWILFASGRNNRVAVERVMRDSEAVEVGIEIGDVFVRYDGERILDSQSLQDATAAGEFGETVAVDIERNGEEIRLYPARGPLGIGLKVKIEEPKPLY